jgi:hypothetical protein
MGGRRENGIKYINETLSPGDKYIKYLAFKLALRYTTGQTTQ